MEADEVIIKLIEREIRIVNNMFDKAEQTNNYLLMKALESYIDILIFSLFQIKSENVLDIFNLLLKDLESRFSIKQKFIHKGFWE